MMTMRKQHKTHPNPPKGREPDMLYALVTALQTALTMDNTKKRTLYA